LQEALLLMPAGPERYWNRIETAPVGVALRLIVAPLWRPLLPAAPM
jgi:hypothetical protein